MTAQISYLLDTNVISEMMRPVPAARVVGFLDSIADQGLGLAVNRNLSIVTRNESEFRNTGARIVNSWAAL